MLITIKENQRLINRIILPVFCFTTLVITSGCNKASQTPEPTANTSLSASPLVSASAMPDATVVEVNGTKLTNRELDQKIDKVIARAGANMPPEYMEQQRMQMRQNMIEAFVAETILTKEADQQNIVVADSEVSTMIEDIKGKLAQNAPEGSDPLESIGMTENEIRTNVERELKIRKLLEPQMEKAGKASDEEIEAFYKEQAQYFQTPEAVEARHILVTTKSDDADEVKAEKKALIEKCRTELQDGADFAELAKKNSDCPSKESGGSLGSFGRGQMVKEFEDAAFSQKVDEIGPIVKTEYGYHIIQVLKHDEANSKPLEEVKSTIADYINRNKQQEVVMAYIDDLKSKSDIKYTENTQNLE